MGNRPINVIMLAGGLRASTFRRQLGIPTLCLPFGPQATLLDAWLCRLEELECPTTVRIVVSWERDVTILRRRVAEHRDRYAKSFEVKVEMDPAPWRGTGGLLHDVVQDLEDEDMVLVIESSSVPPSSLQPIITTATGNTCGVVASSHSQVPTGVYALRRDAFRSVPVEGFFDLKEQLLPRLYKQGRRLKSIVVAKTALRLRDAATYLGVVRETLVFDGESTDLVAPGATVSPTARIVGGCIIEDEVVLDDGAVVHDSVFLRGARVGAGAIVSRSIVGAGAVISPGSIIRDTIEPYMDNKRQTALRVHGNGTLKAEPLISQR